MKVFISTFFTFLLFWGINTNTLADKAMVVCDEPTFDSLGTITANSAELFWRGATPTTYNVQFDSAGFALGAGTIVTGLMDSFYLMTGLMGDASYEIYIQAYCSTTDTSDWYGPIFFHTVCPAQPGDDINNPIVVSTLPYNDANRTLCYTNQYNNPNGYSAGDVFYQFTTSNSSCIGITASMCTATNYDGYLYLIDDQGFLKTEDDDGCAMPGQFGTPAEINNFPVEPNKTYYLVVSGWLASEGLYTLDISENSRSLDLSGGSTDATVAGGTDGTAYVTVSGGIAPYTYLWSTNETTANITGLAVGVYDVTVTDATGCSANYQTEVGEPCPANLSLTMTGINGTEPGTGGATVTVGGGVPPYTYLWSTGSTTSSIDSVQSFGTYFVTVTDVNGCSDVAGVTLTKTNQIEGLTLATVFPNPVSEHLFLDLAFEQLTPVTIELISMTGQIMLTTHCQNIYHQTFGFDVGNYSAGLYLIRVTANQQTLTKKVAILGL